MKRFASLAERIANSNCRACGARGHWKGECLNRDRSGQAEANTTMEENDHEYQSELMDAIPEDTEFAPWKVRAPPHHLNQVPPEHLCVNEEFIFTNHESVVHGSRKTNKSFLNLFPNFKQVFKRALETSFGVVRSQVSDRVEHALGSERTGIIDTGASKSVVGEKRAQGLLPTLKPSVREGARWKKSETVFKFGNNETLKSLGALYLPFGHRWLKVEVVKGWTPFLISNAFLHSLGADISI